MTAQRRIDQILADDYLDDLAARTTADVRAMRDACEEEEAGISYARRVLQGRLDILRAEAVRRRDAGEAGTQAVLEALPDILADQPHARSGPARTTRFLVPPSVQYHRRDVDALVSDDLLASLPSKTADDLARLAEQLGAREGQLSAVRRALLDRIDALQAEITRRYKSGEADISEVLARRA